MPHFREALLNDIRRVTNLIYDGETEDKDVIFWGLYVFGRQCEIKVVASDEFRRS
jgi:hypothetical protein